MQLSNRPRNQYLPVAGGAAAGLAFASNRYRDLYNAYNTMRNNWRSGRTKSRFSKNMMVSRVNQRIARSNALNAKRASNKRKTRFGGGTNFDSQYVGRFNGSLLKRKRPNRYHRDGYTENVETHGVVNTPVAYEDGPVRFVVQAVNPPRMIKTIAIAFLRKIMKVYYKHDYQSIEDVFQLNTVVNYEIPYQLVFTNTIRTSQTAATNSTVTYTPGAASTLSDAADWLVTNVLTSSSFGYGYAAATHRYLSGVDIYDRVNAIVTYKKRIDLDKHSRVTFWSSLKCRLQNITSAGPFTNTTTSLDVAPLHGNILFSTGHCPRVRNDNTAGVNLVPFTFENIPNGVIIPTTYSTDTWYRTIQGPEILDSCEKGVNVNLGAGQIKDFTMYYRTRMTLSQLIAKFSPGSANGTLVGTDAYGIVGLNRNALIQLEKFVDTASNDPPIVNYHCEWDMGAIVSFWENNYLPKGYFAFEEDSPLDLAKVEEGVEDDVNQ